MGDDNMTEVLAAYHAKGHEADFGAREDASIHCSACRATEPAAQAPVLAMHRLEGTSDPSEQAIVAVLECPACGATGTMVLSYGPEASPEDSAVLLQLLDGRDQASIAPGM